MTFRYRPLTLIVPILLTMARNEAAALGANAVVASSEIIDGKQTFDALRCGD